DYVRHGGSVAYFLGDKARPSFYNDMLYKKYEALFPLLIGPTAYNAIDPNGNLTEEERQEKRKDRRQNDPQPKLLFRDPNHPLNATLTPYSSVFRYLGIDVSHRAEPRSRWRNPTAVAGKADEIVLLPNNQDIGVYKGTGQDLARRALELTTEVAKTEE